MSMLRWIVPALLALPLAACGPPRSRDGIDAACSRIVFEETRFTVCQAKPDRHEVLLADKGADGKAMRDFAGLGARLEGRAPRIAFAMNAGMYDGEGLPIGYYVEDGAEKNALNRRDGPGNFHLRPNGVFYGDASGWHVAETEAFAKAKSDHIRFATQSGPMLVIAGKLHPKFSDNGESLHIRNGVGVAADGSAWFAISDDPVSFGRIARLFRDKLSCANALYLDGKVSRLWDPVAQRKDSGAAIGPIVVALQRE